MEKSDVMFYSAYIILFILLGVWFLFWALDYVGLGEMFLFWLLSAGVLMILLGTIRTREAPSGSTLLLGSGMLLSIVMLMFLAIATDMIGGWVGAAVGMILIGIVVFIILLLNMRNT